MKKVIKILSFLVLVFLLSSCNNTNKQAKVIDIKLTDEQYAFVVKKGNKTLVDEKPKQKSNPIGLLYFLFG